MMIMNIKILFIEKCAVVIVTAILRQSIVELLYKACGHIGCPHFGG